MNKAQRIHELKLQLELAQMVTKLTGAHMWSQFAAQTMQESVHMQEEIKRAIKKEQESPDV